MQAFKSALSQVWIGERGPAGFGLALLAVAITTVVITVAIRFVDLGNVGAIYLVPVLIAAMRWGLAPALLAATTSIAASAFFFYQPIYSFHVQSWEQLIDLIIFTVVAFVISELVVSLKRQAEIADRATRSARARAETDQLRDALIGSVSHELRTPLASILGASTVICDSPVVRADSRLTELASVVRDEAERLDNDIQNLLDATRISREGVRPRIEWTEPADIVNVALEHCRAGLAAHVVDVEVAADLPLVHVDPVLIEHALRQVLGNAAKYAPKGSRIVVGAHRIDDEVVLSVSDQGSGLTEDESTRLGEKFFRGARHLQSTTGSGLGLWIATSFLRAHGGRLEAKSEGVGRGTTISLRLPVPPSKPEPADPSDE